MKKRKRKLTEEERRAAIRREAERIESGQAQQETPLGSAKPDGASLHRENPPHSDNPRIVATGLAQELRDFPSSGVRTLAWIMERRGKDQRFLGQMLIALGKYLLKGKPMFDNMDIEIAKLLVRFKGRISIARMILELPVSITGCNPDKKFKAMLKQQLRRWLKPIPREYLEPPL